MSRRVNPKTVKSGDRVRVGRESDEYGTLHSIKFGAVCTVLPDIDPTEGLLYVSGPHESGQFHLGQWVDISSCKVVK